MQQMISDYQHFDLVNGNVENIGPRMEQKLSAIPFPEDFEGKSVLDVGCDFGFWSFLSAQRGASKVLGLDRGREVKGHGYIDLAELNNRHGICEFKKTNLGKQWRTYGKHDIVLLMSLYHHIYHQCEKHLPIWYWLYRHTTESLIWENPTDNTDSVVKMNVSGHLHPKYTQKHILEAASAYFNYRYIGPAEHEPTRSVFIFTPRKLPTRIYAGRCKDGAGGASKAFQYKSGRRMEEIRNILGFTPYPGSLNVHLETPFNWDIGYFRSRVLDVANRKEGLDSHWVPRWARFYPVIVGGMKAFVFKFEGDTYPENFIELIAEKRVRDFLRDSSVMVQCL